MKRSAGCRRHCQRRLHLPSHATQGKIPANLGQISLIFSFLFNFTISTKFNGKLVATDRIDQIKSLKSRPICYAFTQNPLRRNEESAATEPQIQATFVPPKVDHRIDHYQCDQTARLFLQYLANHSNENRANSITSKLPKWRHSPNLVTLTTAYTDRANHRPCLDHT